MKKIRINELARELEVKAHEILDRLPELGVAEKKTHSSSIDEDVADKLRIHFGHAPQMGLGGDSSEDHDHEETGEFTSVETAPQVHPPAPRHDYAPAAPGASAPEQVSEPSATPAA